MKPLQLEISAFGSYGGTETVDFQKADHGIFLITGDTGAGKTTIFDAVSFALFGETSGGQRDSAMMRSQYAGEDTETYVRLKFMEDQKLYEIRRSPSYDRISMRKNKQGEYKKINVPPKAGLILPDGSEYQGSIRDINRKVQELIGVDREQFSQIAMIAQGEYLKLLHATSRERKAIFSRIFNTGIYGRIQMRLKERFNRLYGRLEDNRKVARHEQENAVILYDSAYGAEWKELQQFPETGNEQVQGLLNQMVGEAKEREQELKTKREQGQRKLTDMEHKIAGGREVNSLFDRLESGRKSLDQLKQQTEEIREQKKNLKKGQRAEKVYPAELAFCEAQTASLQSDAKAAKLKVQSRGKAEELRLEKKNLKDREAAYKKQVPQLDQEMIRLSTSLGSQIQELTEKIRGLEELLKNVEELSLERKVLKESREKLLVCQQKTEQADAEYNRRYRLFLEAQAGIMAQTLKEKMPCPVCGSTEHPHKASVPGDEISQKKVEEAKVLREQTEQERSKTADACIRKNEACKQLEKIVLEAGKRWIGSDFSLAFTKSRLNEILGQNRTLLMTVEKKTKADLCQLKTCKENLESELQESREKVGSLAEEERLLKGTLEAEQENSVLRKGALSEKKALYGQAKKDQGFRSEQEYREAHRTSALLETWEKEIQEYEKKLLQLQTRQKEYKELTKGKQRVELSRWQQEAEVLGQELKLLRQGEVETVSVRSANEKVLRNLRELEKQREALEKEYLVIRNLYQTANGKLKQQAGLDFQTFVQRQYFSQMVQAANHRLKIMSDSQFILQCRELDALGKQGEVGLDLDVYSIVTGKKRDVKTLSGGESFMAALALALGMADIIQNTAGKVRVDTMFIDEGFGSLDVESRMRAIRILQELSGGQRSIGIISHVTELKEQIDRKLVVVKNEKGSHIRWELQ